MKMAMEKQQRMEEVAQLYKLKQLDLKNLLLLKLLFNQLN